VPHTLLLADDSVTIQRVIELTFADEDIKVVAVSDGDQAIAQLDTAPPDIVLADVGMPGRNGYEVAAYVKQSPRLSHIPVVLLTGAFEPVDQATALAVGCDGVLAKPFEPQLVIGRVKELLGRPGKQATSLDLNIGTPLAAAADSWSPSALNHPLGEATATAPKLNEYFDRLDAAFSNASPQQGTALADLPLSYASPPPQGPKKPQPMPPPPSPGSPAPTASVAPESPAPRAAQASTPPAPTPSSVPLVDAFAALLAAEQGAPAPAVPPQWPSRQSAAAAPAATETAQPSEDLIEQVTRRVLERLSDRVVRETVAGTVSTLAERLIREEIERIKASIK
jgi:CheY-like chemotaxis protein